MGNILAFLVSFAQFVSNSLLLYKNNYVDAIAQQFALRWNRLGFYEGTKLIAAYQAVDQAVAVSQTTINLFNGSNVLFPFASGFPKDEPFTVTAIEICTGANATLAATQWGAGISDAALMQGTLTFTVNGSVVLKQIPLSAFKKSDASAVYADVNAGILPLAIPIDIQPQAAFAMQIAIPTASATANLNIRAVLHGVKAI